jgi:periplasmic copper chaperone A
MENAMFHLSRKCVLAGLAAGTVALAQLVSSSAQAADYDIGPIHIAQPWARATPKGASTGAAYMTITNTAATPDRLSCVATEAAAQCQIHTMTMDGGVMKMRPVEGGLEIQPGETVMLKPSSLHVMFLNLKHPLEAGKTVAATLKFEKAGTAEIGFPILGIGAPAPGIASGGGGGSMMMDNSHGGMMQMDKH